MGSAQAALAAAILSSTSFAKSGEDMQTILALLETFRDADLDEDFVDRKQEGTTREEERERAMAAGDIFRDKDGAMGSQVGKVELKSRESGETTA